MTIIGAISPPGGDFSEPVTQASLRVVGAMWALDAALAHQRHYPAVDWDTSFSLYATQVAPWFAERAGPDWASLRQELVRLLQQERELREVAGLVGPDALEDQDRWLMEVAALARDVVLRQNAFHAHDARSSVAKTHALAASAIRTWQSGRAALEAGQAHARLALDPVRRAMIALRDAPDDDVPARSTEALAAASAVGGARATVGAT